MACCPMSVAIGLLLALAVGSVLSSVLFGVGGRDPVTFTVVALALAGVALAASLRPAWNASRADPVKVLKADGWKGNRGPRR